MSSTKGSSQEEHQTLSFFLLLPPSLHMHGHMISKITCPHWHVSRHMISSTSILISSYVFQGGTRAILYSLFIKINLESYIYIYTRSHKLLINFVFFRFLTMFFIFFFFSQAAYMPYVVPFLLSHCLFTYSSHGQPCLYLNGMHVCILNVSLACTWFQLLGGTMCYCFSFMTAVPMTLHRRLSWNRVQVLICQLYAYPFYD